MKVIDIFKQYKIKPYKFIKFLIVNLSIIFSYNLILYFLGLTSTNNINALTTETPIIILIISSLYFPHIESKVIKCFFPSIPILIVYILFDHYYSYLHRPPRLSDFHNLSVIFEYSPLLSIFIWGLASLVPITLLSLLYFYAKKLFSLKIIIYRISIIVLIIVFLFTNAFFAFQKNTFNTINYSQLQTIKTNGRISSFIFYSNIEKENKKNFLYTNYSKVNIKKVLYKDSIINKPNIHIIVLESFINPNYIQEIKFNKDPLADELKHYLINKDSFSKVISPVYGGRTPQAEFELLTGIKALSRINSIEFNAMNGGKINSFVKQLKDNNYKTIATIATSSDGFNSKLAYKSLGFENTEFLKESKSIITNNISDVIFDGDLFNYNLDMLNEYFRVNDKPIFNYVLGIYGHTPYRLDKIKKIKLRKSNNEELERITNQFYYRTKAIANYIKNLIKIDPDAIVYITSDHLPSILDKNIKYKFSNKVNIAILISNGKTIDFKPRNYYQIPWLIWNILSGNNTKRNIEISEMEKLYLTALSESM